MTKADIIIAVAGWEERFLKGLERDIADYKPTTLVLLIFEEYSEMTLLNRVALGEVCKATGVKISEASLRRQPTEVWRTLQETLSRVSLKGKRVLLEISTMPREVIWWSLKVLQEAECCIEYVYHRPGEYSADWLTRDTGEPRLVYQCSGIARLGLPTGLLLLSGFDLDRARRMIQYFEPTLILLGIQEGQQFENDRKNIVPSLRMSDRMSLAKPFAFDAYGDEQGFNTLVETVRPHLFSHNIIATSLGPKISGIALYRLQSAYPEIGLAYAPSRQLTRITRLGSVHLVQEKLSFQCPLATRLRLSKKPL